MPTANKVTSKTTISEKVSNHFEYLAGLFQEVSDGANSLKGVFEYPSDRFLEYIIRNLSDAISTTKEMPNSIENDLRGAIVLALQINGFVYAAAACMSLFLRQNSPHIKSPIENINVEILRFFSMCFYDIIKDGTGFIINRVGEGKKTNIRLVEKATNNLIRINFAKGNDWLRYPSESGKEEGNVPDAKGIDAVISKARKIAPELQAELLEANIRVALSATEAGTSLSASEIKTAKSEVTSAASTVPGLQPHAKPPDAPRPISPSKRRAAELTAQERKERNKNKAKYMASWRAKQRQNQNQP